MITLSNRLDALFAELKTNISFVDLSRVEGFSANERNFFHPNYKNVILWSNISNEGEEYIRDILSKDWHMSPCSVLTYMIDGACMTFPLAQKSKNYKVIHWLPVVFNHDNTLHNGAQS